MSVKQQLLTAATTDPIAFRSAIQDTRVSAALGSIGILPKVLELHAPSTNARKTDGVGETLCGIRGTRHKIVTCERCKKSLSKGA